MNNRIALDLPYNNYASNQQYYQRAFTAGLCNMLDAPLYALTVNDFQKSSNGNGTIVYFDVLLPTQELVVNVTYALIDLFPGASPLSTNVPSVPQLVSAFHQNGLPAAAAYYNDQMTAPTLVLPTVTDGIGTWPSFFYLVQQYVYLVNVSSDEYFQSIEFYNSAFLSSIAIALQRDLLNFEIYNTMKAGDFVQIFIYELIDPAALSTESSTALINGEYNLNQGLFTGPPLYIMGPSLADALNSNAFPYAVKTLDPGNVPGF